MKRIKTIVLAAALAGSLIQDRKRLRGSPDRHLCEHV